MQDWTMDELTVLYIAGLDNGRIYRGGHYRTEQRTNLQGWTLQDWTTDEFTGVDTAGLDNG